APAVGSPVRETDSLVCDQEWAPVAERVPPTYRQAEKLEVEALAALEVGGLNQEVSQPESARCPLTLEPGDHVFGGRELSEVLLPHGVCGRLPLRTDRKSTRLNSSHGSI